MLVTIKYFGMILEITQTESEQLEINNAPTTTAEIELLLIKKHPQLTNLTYNIALNQKIQSKTTLVTNGDELAFLPPFAGG